MTGSTCAHINSESSSNISRLKWRAADFQETASALRVESSFNAPLNEFASCCHPVVTAHRCYMKSYYIPTQVHIA